jgi:hypothetical protein
MSLWFMLTEPEDALDTDDRAVSERGRALPLADPDDAVPTLENDARDVKSVAVTCESRC